MVVLALAKFSFTTANLVHSAMSGLMATLAKAITAYTVLQVAMVTIKRMLPLLPLSVVLLKWLEGGIMETITAFLIP